MSPMHVRIPVQQRIIRHHLCVHMHRHLLLDLAVLAIGRSLNLRRLLGY